MSREGAGPLVVTLRVTTIGPMGALPLVDKTSGVLTWTHTLLIVSSGLPGSIGPAHGNAVTCSVGRHWAGTTEHGSGTAEQRVTGFGHRFIEFRWMDSAANKDLPAYIVGIGDRRVDAEAARHLRHFWIDGSDRQRHALGFRCAQAAARRDRARVRRASERRRAQRQGREQNIAQRARAEE